MEKVSFVVSDSFSREAISIHLKHPCTLESSFEDLWTPCRATFRVQGCLGCKETALLEKVSFVVSDSFSREAISIHPKHPCTLERAKPYPGELSKGSVS